MRCSARTRATPARRWRWRRWRTCSTRASCATTRANPAVARPGPVRAVGGARLDAAVLDALPDRVRAHARRPQELPPAREPDRRAPRVRARRGHRGHHRAARPGHLDVRGAGAGRAHAGRALQRRRAHAGRPSHVHDRERRRHAGGRRLGGVLARGPPRARAPDRLLRRQPHLDRGRHERRVLRGRGRAASRPTAGTCRISARTSSSTRSRRRRGPRSRSRTGRR